MPDTDRWLEEGLDALVVGNLPGALTALRVVAGGDDPTDPPADWPLDWQVKFFDLLGGCRLKRGEAMAAADAYERALTLDEGAGRGVSSPAKIGNSWAYLGISLARLQRFAEAEICVSRGLVFMGEGGLLPAYRGAVATEFGLVLLDEGHYPAAADAFRHAVALAIEADEPPRVVGHLWHLLGTALQPVVLMQRLVAAIAPWLDPLGASQWPGFLAPVGDATFAESTETLRQELHRAFHAAVSLKSAADLPASERRPSELALENLPKFDDAIDAISAVVRNAMRDLVRAQSDAEAGIDPGVIASLKGRAWEAAGDFLAERDGPDTAGVRAWQQAALFFRHPADSAEFARVRAKLESPANASANSGSGAMRFAVPPAVDSAATPVIPRAIADEFELLVTESAATVAQSAASGERTAWHYWADGGGAFRVVDGEWMHVHGWYDPTPLEEIERTAEFVTLHNPASGEQTRLFTDRAEQRDAGGDWQPLFDGEWA